MFDYFVGTRSDALFRRLAPLCLSQQETVRVRGGNVQKVKYDQKARTILARTSLRERDLLVGLARRAERIDQQEVERIDQREAERIDQAEIGATSHLRGVTNLGALLGVIAILEAMTQAVVDQE